MLNRLRFIIAVLSFWGLMVPSDTFVFSGVMTRTAEGEPSGDTLIDWKIEEGTGHLIAWFPHIAYRYYVEAIRRFGDCKKPKEDEYIRWTVGYGDNVICYFTLQEPEWVMWKSDGKWLWLGKRMKGAL